MLIHLQRNLVRRAILSPQSFPSWINPIALAIALGAAYFLAARLSLGLLTKDGVAVFWPAAGVAAGVLIGLGPATRWPVVVGVMGATILANVLGDRNVWSAIVFAFCNAGEAMLVAALVDRFFGSPFNLDNLRRVLGLVAAAIIATAVSGIGGTAGFLLFHSATAPAATIWQHWFASDAIGIITVAPFLIGLPHVAQGAPRHKELLEGILALTILTAVSALMFYLPSQVWAIQVLGASTLPVLLWIAARCKPVFAATAAFITSLMIVWSSTFGIGIFGNSDLPAHQGILSAQASILTWCLCTLVIAALFAERRRHETIRAENEARLQEALKATERADRAKSSFLAAASHDLRQPLQTLQLLHGTLEKQAQNSEARTLLSGIGRSLETMSDMLTSLLDINQLETGILRPSRSDFPVNDVFDLAATDFLEPIKQKGLEFCLVRSRITVHSDRRMLTAILRNLLSNAVRYTERGKILVGCRRAGDEVRIEVWDSGVGIMGDQLPRIFEEYYSTQESERYGGFGLGLAIVQRLANLLEHRIDVHSTPGKGSCFSIRVPMGREHANAVDRTERPPQPVDAPFLGTILVIEDETSVRAALDRLLRFHGLDVISVATGNEALALVTEKGICPSLLVSDYNLPGEMNGVKSIEALRAALGRKIPAIVLTGDIRSPVTQAISKHDVSIAIKPVKADEILRLINRHRVDAIAGVPMSALSDKMV